MRSANRSYYVAALLAAVLFGGCWTANYYAKQSPEVIAGEVTVQNDPYKASIEYSTPQVDVPGYYPENYHLRGWKDRNTGSTIHQLYVMVAEPGWAFYQSATFPGGIPTELVSIDKEVGDCSGGSCTVIETFGIAVPQDFLAAHSAGGFSVEAQSHAGTALVIDVPASYVQGYLMAMGHLPTPANYMKYMAVTTHPIERCALSPEEAATLKSLSDPQQVLNMTCDAQHRALALGVRPSTAAASSAAQSWLKLIDQSDYHASFEQASSLFKNAVSAEQWSQQLGAVRKPLGAPISRRQKNATYATSMPGAPDGQYVVIQYDTSFEHKQSAVETVTPMLDKDGQWRVSGYYIK